MAWLAVDKNGDEYIYQLKPRKIDNKDTIWFVNEACDYEECDYAGSYYVALPKSSIKKLITKELTWDDEPVEI